MEQRQNARIPILPVALTVMVGDTIADERINPGYPCGHYGTPTDTLDELVIKLKLPDTFQVVDSAPPTDEAPRFISLDLPFSSLHF